ncbi:hypothetical protein ACFX13_015275 [Malus domestica]
MRPRGLKHRQDGVSNGGSQGSGPLRSTPVRLGARGPCALVWAEWPAILQACYKRWKARAVYSVTMRLRLRPMQFVTPWSFALSKVSTL